MGLCSLSKKHLIALRIITLRTLSEALILNGSMERPLLKQRIVAYNLIRKPISNRSVFRPWRMSASEIISNPRIPPRTHGGVAGVSGQPLPLCRSNRLRGSNWSLSDGQKRAVGTALISL